MTGVAQSDTTISPLRKPLGVYHLPDMPCFDLAKLMVLTSANGAHPVFSTGLKPMLLQPKPYVEENVPALDVQADLLLEHSSDDWVIKDLGGEERAFLPIAQVLESVRRWWMQEEGPIPKDYSLLASFVMLNGKKWSVNASRCTKGDYQFFIGVHIYTPSNFWVLPEPSFFAKDRVVLSRSVTK